MERFIEITHFKPDPQNGPQDGPRIIERMTMNKVGECFPLSPNEAEKVERFIGYAKPPNVRANLSQGRTGIELMTAPLHFPIPTEKGEVDEAFDRFWTALKETVDRLQREGKQAIFGPDGNPIN